MRMESVETHVTFIFGHPSYNTLINRTGEVILHPETLTMLMFTPWHALKCTCCNTCFCTPLQCYVFVYKSLLIDIVWLWLWHCFNWHPTYMMSLDVLGQHIGSEWVYWGNITVARWKNILQNCEFDVSWHFIGSNIFLSEHYIHEKSM